jgi:hypothetical protein
MKIHQISVFLENKPGRLSALCLALADAGINILALSLADTSQFGVLRLIVADWEKARQVLEKAGCAVNVTQVVAVGVEDKPGGLANVLEPIEKAGINLEYMYAFAFRAGGEAALVLCFADPDAAIEALRAKGCRVLDHVELLDRAKA